MIVEKCTLGFEESRGGKDVLNLGEFSVYLISGLVELLRGIDMENEGHKVLRKLRSYEI